jgi:septal ring factor EnvC (AmiA/AmiB activator)
VTGGRDRLESELQAANARVSELEPQLTSAQAEVAARGAALASAEARVRDLEQALGLAEAKVKQLSDDRDLLFMERDDLRGALAAVEKVRAEQGARLNEVSALAESSSTKLSEVEGALARAESELSRTSRDASARENTLKTLLDERDRELGSEKTGRQSSEAARDTALRTIEQIEASLEQARFELNALKTERESTVTCEAAVTLAGVVHALTGTGNGPIAAFVRALAATPLPKFDVLHYSEHSLGSGAEARAVSYIQIKTERGLALYGAGIDTNIELASIKAIVSALNRALAK